LNSNYYAIVQDAGRVQNLKRHVEYCTISLKMASLNCGSAVHLLRWERGR